MFRGPAAPGVYLKFVGNPLDRSETKEHSRRKDLLRSHFGSSIATGLNARAQYTTICGPEVTAGLGAHEGHEEHEIKHENHEEHESEKEKADDEAATADGQVAEHRAQEPCRQVL